MSQDPTSAKPYGATWDPGKWGTLTYVYGPNGPILNLKVSSLGHLQDTLEALNDAYQAGAQAMKEHLSQS